MDSLFVNDKIKQSKSSKKIILSEKILFPVITADGLLSSTQHEKLLANIKDLVTISDKNYQDLYQKMIDNFTEFVQVIPVTNQRRLGSLLEEGLRRALFVLQFQRLEKDITSDPLETYMLFSVALLFDIARVIEKRSILLSEQNGAFIERWLPLCSGSMIDRTKYYRIRLGSGYASQLCRRITPALAKPLLPERGFLWLAKNSQMFARWWALLSDDYAENDGYKRILSRAHEKTNDFVGLGDYELPVNVEAIESELELGDEFVEWFEEGLVSGDIKVDAVDGKVQTVGEQLFIDNEVFQDFADSKQVTRQAVVEQFSELGYVAEGEDYQSQVQQDSAQQDATQKSTGNKTLFNNKTTSTQAALFANHVAVTGTFESSSIIKNGIMIPADMSAILAARGISTNVDSVSLTNFASVT